MNNLQTENKPETRERAKILRLKRVVTIKAIVTDQFKKYLVNELNRAIKNLDIQGQNLDFQGNRYLSDLETKGLNQQVTAVKQQIELEKQQRELAKAELRKKIDEAKNLPLDSEFIQGTVDGWVDVKKGDNLYAKLGSVEIIIKDGIIQEIKGDIF